MNAMTQEFPVVVHETADWRLRLATPGDNARLCEIFRAIDMDAELRLTEERDPDFFALHRLHLGRPYTVVLEDKTVPPGANALVGCCSVVVREAWLNGERRKIGYSGDLRVLPSWRKARVFPLAVRMFTQYLEEMEGIEAIFCAMMRENVRAKGARLLARGKLMTPYHMVSIQVMGKGKAPRQPVERATEKDIPAIAAFLGEKSKKRTFGYIIDEQVLRERLRTWPGLRIEDFFLIRNNAGGIVACTAPLDTEENVRRSRVLGYAGRMVPLRKLYNAEAMIRGFPSLPKEGECFHYASLTHLEVENDDPQLCNDLLKGVYQALHGQKLHFISAFIPEGSTLQKSFFGFRTREIPMDLYTFVSERSPLSGQDFFTLQPGYEMVLH